MICPYLWNETEIQINEKGKYEHADVPNIDDVIERYYYFSNDLSVMRNKYLWNAYKNVVPHGKTGSVLDIEYRTD